MEKRRSQELIGASPDDVLRTIVDISPEIALVNFWKYSYVPLQVGEQGENPMYATRDEILEGTKIGQLFDTLKGDEQLAISSQMIMVSDKIQHLPLMDFSLSKSPENLELLKTRLDYIGCVNGWILESGKSYHYWGAYPLPEKEWINFMGKCLLTSVVHDRDNIQEIADPRFIGHSLIRGCNTLRMSTRADKTFKPMVVASSMNKSSADEIIG